MPCRFIHRFIFALLSFSLFCSLIVPSFASSLEEESFFDVSPIASVPRTSWVCLRGNYANPLFRDLTNPNIGYLSPDNQAYFINSMSRNTSNHTSYRWTTQSPQSASLPNGVSFISFGQTGTYNPGDTVTVSWTGLFISVATKLTSESTSGWGSSFALSSSTSNVVRVYLFDDTGRVLGSTLISSSGTISVVLDHSTSYIGIGTIFNVEVSSSPVSYNTAIMTLGTLDITRAPANYASTLSAISSTLNTMNTRVNSILTSIGSSLGVTVTSISNTLNTINSGISGILTAVDAISSNVLVITTKLDGIQSTLESISSGIVSSPSQDQDAQDAVDRMDSITDEIDSMTDEIEQGTNRPPVSEILPAVNEDILNPTDQSASFALSTVGGVLEVSFIQTLLIFVVSLCFIRYVIFGRSG